MDTSFVFIWLANPYIFYNRRLFFSTHRHSLFETTCRTGGILYTIKKELTLSPLAKKIIISYLKLNKDDRATFESFFGNLITEILNDDTINLDNKPQLKLISFGGDNETKELNQEQANLNINNLDIENNDL